MSLEPGQIIDAKYRVVRRIGEGGMGTVYEGENSRIGRRVAIKVLHAQVAAMPEFVERFEREARAAARIGSPYVCDVLDLGDLPSGDRYIVMEYLDGVSFEDRIDGGKLTPAQLAPIAFELLEGLGTMHAARVIHRDLKPANVFLSRTNSGRGESVKILDFGVAKLLPMGGEVGTMTQTGTMMGTPLYMSPEQARGARDVDGRTDIYAASVMFYRALAGVLPYHAETLNELLFKIVLEDPKPLREVAPEVDELFAEIVHKGLARDLTQRYATAREYQQAIAAWGKAQGRASLAFAVTSAFEQPLSSGPNYVKPASSPSQGQAAGTPIAWADDAARSARVPSGTATVMDHVAMGSSGAMPMASAVGKPSSQTPAVPKDAPVSGAAASSGTSAAASVGDGNAPPANSTMASSAVGEAPSSAEPAIAIATTIPAVSIAELTKAQPAARSKRGLIFGIAGAGALALVAVFAFGRGGGGGSTSTSTTRTGDNTQPTPSTNPSAALVIATSGAPSAATPVAVDANATTATAQLEPSGHASANPTSAPMVRRDLPATTHRREVPKPTAAATTTTTTSPATAAPVPPASAATAKPAASARKFRQNID